MEFIHNSRNTLDCEAVFEDEFFLQPIDGMPENYKGCPINLIEQDISLYDDLIESITHRIEIEEWGIDPKRQCFTIGDYLIRNARDIKEFDTNQYSFLVNQIFEHCLVYISKEYSTQQNIFGKYVKLRFDFDDIKTSVINYVNWQLDKLTQLSLLDSSLIQEASQ